MIGLLFCLILLNILFDSSFFNYRGEFNKLIKIIDYEIKNSNVTGNCLNYTEYYNQSFRKYKELDVRWENRYVDICNNKTYCNGSHTFIIVAGYGGECIIDQKNYACVNNLNII